MVTLRLSRFGTKQKPFYRVVAIDRDTPRDGKCLENLGTFDPRVREHAVVWKEERIRHWLSRGAQPSPTVKNLLKKYYKGGVS